MRRVLYNRVAGYSGEVMAEGVTCVVVLPVNFNGGSWEVWSFLDCEEM